MGRSVWAYTLFLHKSY